MKRRFFFKNLFFFLVPLIVAVALLGGFSIYTAADSAQQDFNRSNLNLLRQSRETVELIFGELDSIRQTFDSNYAIINNLKGILESPAPSLEQYRTLEIIKYFLNSPADTKPYIHSIYIYFPNAQSRFIATHEGFVSVDTFYDRDWYTSLLSAPADLQYWTEQRTLRRFDFQKEEDQLFTMYKRTYPAGGSTGNGIIVINIYFSFLNNLLTELQTLENQSILVVDHDNRILLQNRAPDYLDGLDIDLLLSTGQNNHLFTHAGTRYQVTWLPAVRDNDWKYISIVPQIDILGVPSRLMQATGVFLLAALLLGVLLANAFARKNYRQLEGIIDIIQSAESGRPLPEPPSRIKNEYAFLQYNILKTFLVQSYLRVQLSEKHYHLQATELLALQSQINPHFLYNTLDTVSWIAISRLGHPNDISTMLDDLSAILRYSLNDPNKTATLAEEIGNTKSYVAIQKMRYHDKFDVLWRYPEGMDAVNTIKLLLQPLVENSLYHGLKVKTGGGRIKITIQPREDGLRIRVTDNGVGMGTARLAELARRIASDPDAEAEAHIGLCNTAKRLALFYEGAARLAIFSKQGVGTSIRIHLPYDC